MKFLNHVTYILPELPPSTQPQGTKQYGGSVRGNQHKVCGLMRRRLLQLARKTNMNATFRRKQQIKATIYQAVCFIRTHFFYSAVMTRDWKEIAPPNDDKTNSKCSHNSSGWILGTKRTSSFDKFSKNPLPFATRLDGSRARQHVFYNLSAASLPGLRRALNRWTERTQGESVPQGALTTLRTVVCVDGVPLRFQEIRSKPLLPFPQKSCTRAHLHAHRYIQTHAHRQTLP